MKELKKLSLDAREEAQKLREDGNLNAAVAKYQEALRYQPSPALHKELGDLLVELKRYEEARAQYKLALMKNPSMTEVEEAMDRLEARIQLAESGASPGVERQIVGKAGDGGEGSPESAPRGIPEDYLDEDLAFAEMEKIQPPSPSSEPVSTGETEDLFKDSRELFGLTRSESPRHESFSEASSLAAAVSDEGRRRSKPGFRTEPAVARSSLRGGRGLLPPPGRKPSILSSGSRGFAETFEARPRPEPVFTVADAKDSRTPPPGPVPAGRPGERTLSIGRRFPAVVKESLPPEQKSPVETTPPTFDLSQDEPEQALVSSEWESEEKPEKKKRGFFKDLFDTDEEVSYPEPPPPESSQDLLPPVHEREQLDLTGLGLGRFKGKPKRILDIEICKKRYYEEHDLEGAIRCFADKRIDFPTSSRLYYELGLIYQDAGSPQRARENFELALRYDPNNPAYEKALAVADVESARAARENGDLREARRILLVVIDDFPEMVEAHRELAKVYIQEAQSKQEAIDRGEPATDELLSHIRQSWEQAEELYRRVVELAPDNYKDWYNLGVSIQSQFDDAKITSAIRAYERAIELKPDYAEAHRNLAILYETRSVPKALKHYKKALEIARGRPEGKGLQMVTDCLRDIGELYWRTGETEKAADYLTEYLQLVPSDVEVEDILDQITSVPPPPGE